MPHANHRLLACKLDQVQNGIAVMSALQQGIHVGEQPPFWLVFHYITNLKKQSEDIWSIKSPPQWINVDQPNWKIGLIPGADRDEDKLSKTTPLGLETARSRVPAACV